MSAEIEVTEFTDPGCPWCWGSEPTLRWLRHRYGDRVSWRRVFGVQMDGRAGSDSAVAPERVREGWLQMAGHTGAPVTSRLTRAHASTRPAALAAKAAARQGDAVGEATLRRLREAFFVAGRPPDSADSIADAVDGTDGLDVERLLAELESPDVAEALQRDFDEARSPHPAVLGLDGPGPHPGAAKADNGRVRYSFPTLIVRGPAGERVVPGWRSTGDYRVAFEAAAPDLRNVAGRRLTAAQALDRHRSLSPRDLELLCDGAQPPAEAILRQTATAPLWLHPDHALAQRDRLHAHTRLVT